MAYSTDLDNTNPAHLYTVRDQAYFANDYDKIQAIRVQSGTNYNAGLTGPAAAMGSPTTSGSGACTAGRHFIRYRYRDTRTGYVSNPSDLLDQTIAAGTDKLVFTISSTAAVVPSTDSRVTEIMIEMTPVESAEFYVTTTADNANGTVTVSMSDLTLITQTAVSLNWGGVNDEDSWSHNPPPVAAFGCEHKGRHFVAGHYDREYTATVIQSCDVVTVATSQTLSTNYDDRFAWFPDSDLLVDIASIDSDTQLTLDSSWTASSAAVTMIVTAFEPNMLSWSLPLYMESFDTTRNLRRVLEGRADVLRGMVSYRGDLLLFGRKSAEILSFTVDPGVPDGYLIPVPGTRGVLNSRCVVEALGQLYMMDRLGIWTLLGSGPRHISEPVDDIVQTEIDYDYESLFHSAFDPLTNQLLFFYVATGETDTKRALVFDIIRNKWQVYTWQQAITATALSSRADGSVVLVLADENGYTWAFAAQNYRDGVDDDNCLITINSGSTTSVIAVNEDLSALDLAGVFAKFPDSNDTVRIVSNQAASILISSSLGAAPSPGEYCYLGIVPMTYEFKWETGRGTDTRKLPSYFIVEMIAADSGTAKVYFYADGSDTPEQFSQDPSDTAPDGVRIVDGYTYAEFNLDQVVAAIPVPCDFERSLKAVIYSDRPDGVIRLLDARFAYSELPYAGE